MELIKHRGVDYKAALSATRRLPGSQRRRDKDPKKKKKTLIFFDSKVSPRLNSLGTTFLSFVLSKLSNVNISVKVAFKSSNVSNHPVTLLPRLLL